MGAVCCSGIEAYDPEQKSCMVDRLCLAKEVEYHTCLNNSNAPKSTPPSSKSCREASITSRMTLVYTSGYKMSANHLWICMRKEIIEPDILALVTTYHCCFRHNFDGMGVVDDREGDKMLNSST